MPYFGVHMYTVFVKTFIFYGAGIPNRFITLGALENKQSAVSVRGTSCPVTVSARVPPCVSRHTGRQQRSHAGDPPRRPLTVMGSGRRGGGPARAVVRPRAAPTRLLPVPSRW